MYFDAHVRDRIGATVLIGWNGVAVIGTAIKFSRVISHAGHIEPLLQCLSLGASAAFFCLQIWFLAVRLPSIARAAGVAPRVCALLGAYLPAVIILLPANLSPMLQLASALVTTAGTAGSLYAMAYLGNAFSVFPQARRLVTAGPYRIIRHPLYLFGELSVVGIALGYMQPWALLLASLSFLAQFPRMIYEEGVLAATFDDYRSYAARTFRLIPGLY